MNEEEIRKKLDGMTAQELVDLLKILKSLQGNP